MYDTQHNLDEALESFLDNGLISDVLYWDGALMAIDFPQAVDPRVNMNARELLGRDLRNVCGAFRRYGVQADPESIAADLWERFESGAL